LNNNRNNNRRRGRGNNRQQGGGQQLNRIDSRARGNAQQLLDKYRKMAHDAHLNGDRVQEEYYLQFADHYFRVLADQKQRQDETRQRRDDRPNEGGERPRYEDSRGRDDYGDYDYDSDDDQPRQAYDPRRDEAPRGDEPGDDYGESSGESNGGEGGNREASNRDRDEDGAASEYEPVDNPFVRDNRSTRTPARQSAPRRDRRPREDDGGFDASVLPPPIGASVSEADEQTAEEAPAKPRRRTRKPRASDGSDEALEAVG
jgi:Domain of unknown function (DUF4167)